MYFSRELGALLAQVIPVFVLALMVEQTVFGPVRLGHVLFVAKSLRKKGTWGQKALIRYAQTMVVTALLIRAFAILGGVTATFICILRASLNFPEDAVQEAAVAEYLTWWILISGGLLFLGFIGMTSTRLIQLFVEETEMPKSMNEIPDIYGNPLMKIPIKAPKAKPLGSRRRWR
jgi:hypothetical protein